MTERLTRTDIIGLARPALDAHTLGLTSLSNLLADCGLRCVLADVRVCAALDTPGEPASMERIGGWIREHGITALGFSYRLDPEDGLRLATLLVAGLRASRLLAGQGGPVRRLYVAGLPRTCARIRDRHPPGLTGQRTTP